MGKSSILHVFRREGQRVTSTPKWDSGELNSNWHDSTERDNLLGNNMPPDSMNGYSVQRDFTHCKGT